MNSKGKTSLVLALGMLLTSFGSYAQNQLDGHMVTLSADGVGYTHNEAGSNGFAVVYTTCLDAFGTSVGGASYQTISQPTRNDPLWVVRVVLKCWVT